jgi:hypothetical protein
MFDAYFVVLLGWNVISQFFLTVLPGQFGGVVARVYGLK